MKKLLASLLLLVLLLSACAVAKEQPAIPTVSEELTALRRQIDYYEARNAELEEELANAKVELYIRESEYEQRLQALESAIAAPAPEEKEVSTVPSVVWFHEKSNTGATITGVSSTGNLLEIPNSVEGLSVVAVGDSAFAGGAFSSVVIPGGVKEIGWFAFSGCRKLTKVALPASVEKIEYGAFENCPKSLTFLCPEGSYAAAYARSYGFAVKILD